MPARKSGTASPGRKSGQNMGSKAVKHGSKSVRNGPKLTLKERKSLQTRSIRKPGSQARLAREMNVSSAAVFYHRTQGLAVAIRRKEAENRVNKAISWLKRLPRKRGEKRYIKIPAIRARIELKDGVSLTDSVIRGVVQRLNLNLRETKRKEGRSE